MHLFLRTQIKTTMENNNSYTLGVQLYTVREFTQNIDDFTKTLAKLHKIGYENVQISGTGPLAPKEVAQALLDENMPCVATHMSWDRFQNDLDAVIEEHKLWNCKHAAIGMLPVDYYFEDGGLEKFIEELAPVSKKLAEAGIDFSYHNHHHEFTPYNGKLWLEELYDQASPEALKAEIDIYWIQSGGHNPIDWIKRCAGRQPLLHLKDYRVKITREDWVQVEMAAIGEGNLDVPGILQAAKDSGVKHCLIEQDDCYGQDPFELLEKSYRYLNSLNN